MENLDVENAFNTASWAFIIKKMTDRRVPTYITNLVSAYLFERRLIAGGYKREMTAGVPQGSVLGPTLSNILYDDVLKIRFPPGVKITGYADDIALTIAADTIPVLNCKSRIAINKVITWLENHKLKLAPSKTEAVVMKGPYKRDGIRINVQGQNIPLSRAVKYLGVKIDTRGNYGEHVKNVVQKAEKRTSALTKILPNIGGPGSRKRMVMWGVVQSTLLYASPIWYKALKIKRYKDLLEQAQRKILLRVGFAYRTVSASAIQTITGIPPIDILAEERNRLYNAAPQDRNLRRERQTTLETWQNRWSENVTSAQWTKRLIPDVRSWVSTAHRRTDYFLTQFLSGHGSYRAFTKRIGKSDGDGCIYCAAVDNTAHTIFHCPRWEEIRRRSWGEYGEGITPENIVGRMISSSQIWDSISSGIRGIMQQKELDEREYQRGNLENLGG